MSDNVTLQNAKLNFIFNEPPIVGMQVNELSDLLTLKYNYSGRNVWVKSLSQIFYLINGVNGSEINHWLPLRSDFVVTAYDPTRVYSSGEFAIYNDILHYSKISNNTQDPSDLDRWVIVGGSDVQESMVITGVNNGFGRFQPGDTIPKHQNITERFIDAFRVRQNVIFQEPKLSYSPLKQWLDLVPLNTDNYKFLSSEFVNYNNKLKQKLIDLGIDVDLILKNDPSITYYEFTNSAQLDGELFVDGSKSDVVNTLLESNSIYLSLFTHHLLQDSINALSINDYNELIDFVTFEETKFTNIILNQDQTITGQELLDSIEFNVNDGGTEIRRELISHFIEYGDEGENVITDLTVPLNLSFSFEEGSRNNLGVFSVKVYYDDGTGTVKNNFDEDENNTILAGSVQTLPIVVTIPKPLISPKNQDDGRFEFKAYKYDELNAGTETFPSLINSDPNFLNATSTFNIPTIPFFNFNENIGITNLFPDKLTKQTFDYPIIIGNNYDGLFWLDIPNQTNFDSFDNFDIFKFSDIPTGLIIDYVNDFNNVANYNNGLSQIKHTNFDAQITGFKQMLLNVGYSNAHQFTNKYINITQNLLFSNLGDFGGLGVDGSDGLFGESAPAS